MADLRFRVPFTCIVAGGSGSGKTTLLERVLKEPDCFTEPISEICWVFNTQYAKDEKLIERLSSSGLNIKFREEFPESELAEGTLFNKKENSILVLDDIFLAPPKSKILHELFHIICRHQKISLFVTIHNLSSVTGTQRENLGSLIRSCHSIIVFVDRRQYPVIDHISRIYFPFDRKRVLDHFNCILQTGEKYQYLLFDFICTNEAHQVRSGGILPTEKAYYYGPDRNSKEADKYEEERASKTSR